VFFAQGGTEKEGLLYKINVPSSIKYQKCERSILIQ